jgi:hypothetical protein
LGGRFGAGVNGEGLLKAAAVVSQIPDAFHQLQGLANDCGNFEKTDPTRQKCRNRHLICGV